MCIYCCLTRKSLLIYSIIISAIASIYGIAAISSYASKTDNYKILKELLDFYDEYKSIISRRLDDYYNSYTSNNEVYLNKDYEARLNFLKVDFDKHSYGIIRRLNGIENGLGTILFIFPIIFLVIEIAYLIFACGMEKHKY